MDINARPTLVSFSMNTDRMKLIQDPFDSLGRDELNGLKTNSAWLIEIEIWECDD